MLKICTYMRTKSILLVIFISSVIAFAALSCKKDTPKVLPTLTISISNLSSSTVSATGEIFNDGGAEITSRGICWNISPNPTLTDQRTSDGKGVGIFTTTITGLLPGTTYYLRGYATNSVGTSYSNQVVGTTNAVLPMLTTTAVSSITTSSFITGGAITFDGGSAVFARGVCWSTTQAPTITDSSTKDGAGPSSFVSNVTGLSPGSIYYVRAYATNSMGTAYGNQLSVTTLATVPTITTTEVKPATETTASGGGIVESDGGNAVTARGVCWSTNPSPTILNNRTINGTGKGAFTSTLTGLNTNTTYYVRSYATNAVGTGYGEEITVVLYLNTPGPNVTDIDGNIYNSVRIGSQTWLKQNLMATRYRNGNTIPNITDGTVWQNQTTGAYCDFLNSAANGVTYGHLYNYYATTDTRKICPEGWHVPTREEWQTLVDYLGGDNIASSKVRVPGIVYWEHDKGTNSSGFSALGGSWRGDDGVFYYSLGSGAYWWTNSTYSSLYPFYAYLYSDPNNLRTGYGPYMEKRAGLSVRCVKD